MKALHELQERRPGGVRDESLEFLNAHDHDRIMAAHSDALRAVLAGMPDDFAEARLRVFQRPLGIGLPPARVLFSSACLPIDSHLVR